jgi:DNA-binding CsgD family transcriptional regulator
MTGRLVMIADDDDCFAEIVMKIDEASSLAAMQKIFSNICKVYDLANIAYHALYIPGAKVYNPILVLTYDPGWIARYKDNDYFKIDPVVVSGTKGFLPLDWAHLDHESVVARNFFAEADRYNVGRQGITLPVRAAAGERALFTITANMTEREWDKRRVGYMKEFQMIAHYVHDRVIKLSGYREAERKQILSPREMTCLEYAAQGSTVKQIADRLRITDRTVRLYLTSGCAKLNCATIPQAVAKTVSREMLRP